MSQSQPHQLPAVETPSAVMRTYASPTVNDSPVAVWRTEMGPHAAGPRHQVSETQVMVVLEGAADVTVGDQTRAVTAGEGIVLPSDVERQIVAGPTGLVTLTSARPGATARVGDGDPVPVPWAR